MIWGEKNKAKMLMVFSLVVFLMIIGVNISKAEAATITLVIDTSECDGGTPPAPQLLPDANGWTAPTSIGTLYKDGLEWNDYFAYQSINSSGTINKGAYCWESNVDQTIILKPQWKPATCTVTYNLNGGTGTTPWPRTEVYGYTYPLPTNDIFSNSGAAFLGWNTSSDGSGTNYAGGSSYTSKGNVTLYVNWGLTVTFVDWDDRVLKTQNVTKGGAVTPPADPTRPGYVFSKWSPDYSNITSNLTVKAQYTANTYTVTFEDYDGTILKTQPNVPHGTAATPPKNPTRPGYVFSKWSPDYNNISSDLTVKAQYTDNTYTVTFEDYDGTILKTQSNVQHGTSATPPANPTRPGYVFSKWSPDYNNITTNLTVKAQYTANTYTVTFEDYDGTILKTQPNVPHGTAATPPKNPTRPGYPFSKWSPDYNNITSNLTVTAQYTNISYTVKFLDWDGKVLKSESVEFGGAATAPSDPTRVGYLFSGWDKIFDYIVANTTVTAEYTMSKYKLTYDGNGHSQGAVPNPQTCENNFKVKVSDNTGNLNRIGFAFGGWNDKADGTGTSYFPGNQITLSKDAILYAMWNEMNINLKVTRTKANPSLDVVQVLTNQDINYLIEGELSTTSTEASLDIPSSNTYFQEILPDGVTNNYIDIIEPGLKVITINGRQAVEGKITDLHFEKKGNKWVLEPKRFFINVTYQTPGNKNYSEFTLSYKIDNSTFKAEFNPWSCQVGSDPLVPILTFINYTPGDWSNKDVEISIECTQDGVAITKFEQSTDGTSWWGATIGKSTPYLSNTMIVDTEGVRQLYIRGIGTNGKPGTSTQAYTIKIDKTAPRADGITFGKSTTQISGNLSLTNKNLVNPVNNGVSSGVDKVIWKSRISTDFGTSWGEWRLHNEDPRTGSDSTCQIPMSGIGLYEVISVVVDKAGNESQPSDITFIADPNINENIAKIKINCTSTDATAPKVSLASTQTITVNFSSDAFKPMVEFNNLDITFVIDSSESMHELAGSKERIVIVKDKLKDIVTKLKSLPNASKINVSLITFNSTAQKLITNASVVNDYNNIINAIDSTTTADGTNIGDGLRLAYYDLIRNNQDSKKYIVCFSDGRANAYSYIDDGSKNVPNDPVPYIYDDRTSGYGNNFTTPQHHDIDKQRGQYYALHFANKVRTSEITGIFIGEGNEEIANAISTDGIISTDLSESSIIAAFDEIFQDITGSELLGYLKNQEFNMSFDSNVTIKSTDNPNLTINGNNITGELKDMKFVKMTNLDWQLEPYSIKITIGFNAPGNVGSVIDFKYYQNLESSFANQAEHAIVETEPAQYRVNYPPIVKSISKALKIKGTYSRLTIPIDDWKWFADNYDDSGDKISIDKIKNINITDTPKVNNSYDIAGLKLGPRRFTVQKGDKLIESDFRRENVFLNIDPSKIKQNMIITVTFKWKAFDGYDYSKDEADMNFVIEFIKKDIE